MAYILITHLGMLGDLAILGTVGMADITTIIINHIKVLTIKAKMV